MKTDEKKPMTRLESHYLMTNIKAVMTVLLVLYHFVSGILVQTGAEALGQGGALRTAVISPFVFLFLCAVPAFVFITGYGCKDTASCRENAFSLYLIPYLLLMLVMVLENLLFQGLPLRMSPFEPLLQLWYLLSLFWWMLLLKDFARLKGSLIVAFVLMFTVGLTVNNNYLAYSTGIGTLFSLSRTLYFLPVLLLGYRFTAKHLSDLRLSSPWIGFPVGGLFLGGSIATVLYIKNSDTLNMNALFLLKGDKAYVNYLSNMDAWWKVNFTGTLLTVIFLVLTAALLYLLFRFMPKKKIPLLTRLGDSALTVFCLHGLIAVPVGRLLTPLGFHLSFFISIPLSLAVCLLLSLPAVHKTYTRFIFRLGDAVVKKQ